jgi:MoaA/NifB/PqqE/SkfB family radical SAM enzyme
MIGSIVRHFIPFSLPHEDVAYPLLSQASDDLDACSQDHSATRVLEYSKASLYGRLLWRFPTLVAQALALKSLNILLARHHLLRRSSIVRSRPIGLIVDPSNVCELACPGCVHSTRSEALQIFDWRKGTLPQDRFSSLLKTYGPYAIGVYFCNYGEPLLNLRTPQLVRLAKSYLLQTALSTSLSVKKFDADAYVACGLDYMVLSIDGASQAVYERFRRNGNLEMVLENVRRIVEAKKKFARKTPILSWNFLAFEHNVHEIPEASRLAKRLGVDQFRVVRPFEVTWDDPEIRAAVIQPEVRRFTWTARIGIAANWNPFPGDLPASEISQAFGEPWDCVGAGSGGDKGHTCHWLYKNMAMDAGGRVMPCCAAPGPDRDLVFAQFDQSAGDPFNSAKYRMARSYFAQDRMAEAGDPFCAQCEWVNAPVNIGDQHIRTFFRSADAQFFDHRSLELLSEW